MPGPGEDVLRVAPNEVGRLAVGVEDVGIFPIGTHSEHAGLEGVGGAIGESLWRQTLVACEFRNLVAGESKIKKS
uniref:Uncharacterized protein n=1 Tax=Tolypothrix bouteillei VB521301 TaxID=1479485 RepID=A0A0C1N2I4_9CYAN